MNKVMIIVVVMNKKYCWIFEGIYQINYINYIDYINNINIIGMLA